MHKNDIQREVVVDLGYIYITYPALMRLGFRGGKKQMVRGLPEDSTSREHGYKVLCKK